MSEIPCPCDPCGFEVDSDDAARELMEQHIRWIHLPGRDFGRDPVAALTFCMMHSILRLDEFAALLGELLDVEFARATRRQRLSRWVSALACGLVMVAAACYVILTFRTGSWLLLPIGWTLLLACEGALALSDLSLLSSPGSKIRGKWRVDDDDAEER